MNVGRRCGVVVQKVLWVCEAPVAGLYWAKACVLPALQRRKSRGHYPLLGPRMCSVSMIGAQERTKAKGGR